MHRWFAFVKALLLSGKNLPGFFRFREIRKNEKIHICGSHSKKWVQWPELSLYLNSTHPIQ
jgi:hypothetical protein